jgi:hypothetical protein
MQKYTVHLRYYIGDLLVEIQEKDLERIGKDHGVEVSSQRIDNRTLVNGVLREETPDKEIEKITQDVITVETDNEIEFRDVLAVLYEKYRSPRTPYGFWGSSTHGERIAKALADETGGGW